jgi:hypothetical protein
MPHRGLTEDGETSPQGLDAIRQRVYRNSDTLRSHEATIGEHSVKIGVVMHQVASLQASACTREQLDNGLAVATTEMKTGLATATAKIDALHRENQFQLVNFNQKLDTLNEKFSPIMKGIYWVVALIIVGFLTQILNMLVHSPK